MEPPETLFKVVDIETLLHARPTDFYLSMYGISVIDQLVIKVLWDRNTYDDDLMEEWLSEVHKAIHWYLGFEDVKL